MALPEISMSQMPVRIDGVEQTTLVVDQGFKPENILEHQFFPLETVLVKEVDNDLIYSCAYWDVERYWRVFLEKRVYDRLMSRFLQGLEVVVDYRDQKAPKVFLPRERKPTGFSSLYNAVLADLKSMDAEQLQYHLSQMSYDPIWDLGYYKVT